jgi:hypothetical protein
MTTCSIEVKSCGVFILGILDVVKTNTDDVSKYTDGHEKDGITIIATVSASGIKRSIYIMTTGKTAWVETSPLGTLGHTG